jgi:hypothetical protein
LTIATRSTTFRKMGATFHYGDLAANALRRSHICIMMALRSIRSVDISRLR